ncbi:hypothetical protein V6N11_063192 [Hibiscus sabdariffa]|uniref:Uncharacterized protein n=1 Tax=Hibiscus sabdariffa TaxID=183260 RepID=A0ABR2NWM4_9ROSI
MEQNDTVKESDVSERNLLNARETPGLKYERKNRSAAAHEKELNSSISLDKEMRDKVTLRKLCPGQVIGVVYRKP